MKIIIPEVGESVREALLAKWFKASGDLVKRDEPICEIETDKITLDLNAEAAGVLTITVVEGTTVAVGAVIGTIEESSVAPVVPAAVSAARLADRFAGSPTSPSLRREMRERGVSLDELTGSGRDGRITQEDLFARLEERSNMPPASRPVAIAEPLKPSSAHLMPVKPPLAVPIVAEETEDAEDAESLPPDVAGSLDLPSVRREQPLAYSAGREERRPMSPLRRRVAERLVAARQQTAMLTTFNEADLSRVNALRSSSRERYLQLYGVAPSLMPFFVKASVTALKEFPQVNASIDGDDIVYHHYYDIGVAIGGDKGLVVPVVRNADQLAIYEIDQAISGFAGKVRSNHLAVHDLEGGTFTISNGGVYGSMLSTPILNPPQSAVLGMHAIKERPVVLDGQIVIRPMMYLALSYDHRIIDGREAVGFLRRIVELVESADGIFQEGVEG